MTVWDFLPLQDPWVTHVTHVCTLLPAAAAPAGVPRLPLRLMPNAVSRVTVWQSRSRKRQLDSEAGTAVPQGCVISTAVGAAHPNPISHVLSPEAPQPHYLQCTDSVALSIRGLHSRHLQVDGDADLRLQM